MGRIINSCLTQQRLNRALTIMMTIEIYTEKYKADIAALILNIQNNEFNVPVTLADQPDLLDIENFYFKKKGNFGWQ